MPVQAFTDLICQHVHFSYWKKERDGFWLYADRFCAGIELRQGAVGLWRGAGVEYLLEVTAGHPIATTIVDAGLRANGPVVSLQDGFYCVSRRFLLTSVLVYEEVDMSKLAQRSNVCSALAEQSVQPKPRAARV